MEKRTFSPVLTMKEGLLKLNFCWMGRESWHAIKKLFSLPSVILQTPPTPPSHEEQGLVTIE